MNIKSIYKDSFILNINIWYLYLCYIYLYIPYLSVNKIIPSEIDFLATFFFTKLPGVQKKIAYFT